MIKSIKYQLDPNDAQKEFFTKCFGHTRFIYNYMLNKPGEAIPIEDVEQRAIARAKKRQGKKLGTNILSPLKITTA